MQSLNLIVQGSCHRILDSPAMLDATSRDLAEETVALILARAGDPVRLIAIGRRQSTAHRRVFALSKSAQDILKSPADTADIHNLFPPELRP